MECDPDTDISHRDLEMESDKMQEPDFTAATARPCATYVILS